ncbi:hypothetical protein HMPREF9072_01156, partial [Capnocytophaga sp. oral taxon 324 str. F0483]
FKTLPKFEMKKQCVEAIRNFRKETKRLERRKEGILMKKGCEDECS